MNEVRRRSTEVRAAEDLGEGVLVAYATTWESPYQIGRNTTEQIRRGAFSTSRALPYLWNHAHDDVPIGVTRSITEDDKGLRIEVELFLDDPRARSVWRAIKAGAVMTNSIGFVPGKIERSRSGDTDLETIVSGELLEVSAVMLPANPEAETVEVRAVAPAAPMPAVDPTTGQPLPEDEEKATMGGLMAALYDLLEDADELGVADQLPNMLKQAIQVVEGQKAAQAPPVAPPVPGAVPAPAPVAPRSFPEDLSPSLFRALSA